jgi:hypothetical protein
MNKMLLHAAFAQAFLAFGAISSLRHGFHAAIMKILTNVLEIGFKDHCGR